MTVPSIPYDFLLLSGRLKTTFRYSELLPGRRESVADHSWRLALLVWQFGHLLDSETERQRALVMAIVHDIAEAVTGDIDHVRVSDGEVGIDEKRALEKDAIIRIGNLLPEADRESLTGLCSEYDTGTTETARFVRALDKIETLLQMVELGHESYVRPELIANYPDKAVGAFPRLLPFLAETKARLRNEFRKGNIEWKPSYDM